MCPSTTCLERERCYRNEASGTKPNPFRQAYFVQTESIYHGCNSYVPAYPSRVETNQPFETK